MIPLIENLQNRQVHGEERAGGHQGPRGGEIREGLLMASGSPWGEGDEDILDLDRGVGCVQHGSGMKNE